MRAPLVAARGLAWEVRGRRILGPLDVDVHRGERLFVVGPNGAGKTTLLRLLTGLLAPSAGELSWAGRPYSDFGRRDLARRVAYVPQVRPARIPLTVEQLVLQGRYPHLAGLRRAPRRADFAAVEQALETVGIQELRRRPMDELSGGERQIAFVAAALSQEAQLLVLDEPTTHLDPRHQADVAGLIRRLAGPAGRTVVTATHDLALAALVADRIVALKAGRILADGAPAEMVRPEVLARLFDSEFEMARIGDRAVPLVGVPR